MQMVLGMLKYEFSEESTPFLVLENQIQQEYPAQSCDSDDRFHQRPRAQRIFDAEVEVFFKHPEAAIIEVRKYQASCPNGEH